jgi:hypothetical protein
MRPFECAFVLSRSLVACGALVPCGALVACAGETEETSGAESNLVSGTSADADAPLSLTAGDYVLDSEERGGDLTIFQVDDSRATFSLKVLDIVGDGSSGRLSGAAVRRENGWVYDTFDGGDCRLTFKPEKNALFIDQEGNCGLGTSFVFRGLYWKDGFQP